MKGRKGFSLIELLVVIAIIAILAAILFPIMTSAKDKSKAAACLGHQRQMGAAVMMYVDDNNGYYPKAHPANEEWKKTPEGHFIINNGLYCGYKLCWMDRVHPYTKSWQVFRCPAAPRRPGVNDSRDHNYAMNEWLWYNPNYGWRLGKMSALPIPSRTILIAQSYSDYTINNPEGMKYCLNIGDFKECFNHNRGTNIIYGDGHARWRSVDDKSIYDAANW